MSELLGRVLAFAALIAVIRWMIRRDLRAELDRKFPKM